MLTGALPLLAAVALTGCGGGGNSGKTYVFHLRPDSRLSAGDMARSVKIFRARLNAIGVGGAASQTGSQVVIHFPARTLPPYLANPSTIEFYDLPPAMAAGPSDSPPAARAGTVLVTCSQTEDACPPQVLTPYRDYFYLFKTPPALTGADLKGSATRVATDPSTSHPIVNIEFTAAGARKFQAVTRAQAHRGARTHGSQYLAIVFDREIVSFPEIDPKRYPNGLSGTGGAEITGGTSLDDATALADVLKAGVLPAAFHVVP